MLLNTVKENLCVNQIIGQKTEKIPVEGDVIIPDIKPDILNAIHVSGNVCVYKKEVLDGRIKIDGCICANLIYLSDTEENETRGFNTNIEFTKTVDLDDAKEGMDLEGRVAIKSMECKVLNGRKVNIKTILEVKTKVYSNENVDIINKVDEVEDVQMLNSDLNINSLIGMGTSKAYAKDTLMIDNIDDLAEILKTDINIINKDTKVSYNKVLAKADVEIKMLYLTEDNRIGITSRIDTSCRIYRYAECFRR